MNGSAVPFTLASESGTNESFGIQFTFTNESGTTKSVTQFTLANKSRTKRNVTATDEQGSHTVDGTEGQSLLRPPNILDSQACSRSRFFLADRVRMANNSFSGCCGTSAMHLDDEPCFCCNLQGIAVKVLTGAAIHCSFYETKIR